MKKPEKLNDVDYSSFSWRVYPIDLPFDKRIFPLVAALNVANISTLASCEGHLEYDRPNFPWVKLMYERPIVDSIVEEYNSRYSCDWTSKNSILRPKRCASNLDELCKLQESAENLAHFIFDNFVDDDLYMRATLF